MQMHINPVLSNKSVGQHFVGAMSSDWVAFWLARLSTYNREVGRGFD